MRILLIYCIACWLLTFFGLYRCRLRWMHELLTLIAAPIVLPVAVGGLVVKR